MWISARAARAPRAGRIRFSRDCEIKRADRGGYSACKRDRCLERNALLRRTSPPERALASPRALRPAARRHGRPGKSGNAARWRLARASARARAWSARSASGSARPPALLWWFVSPCPKLSEAPHGNSSLDARHALGVSGNYSLYPAIWAARIRPARRRLPSPPSRRAPGSRRCPAGAAKSAPPRSQWQKVSGYRSRRRSKALRAASRSRPPAPSS
jgi:hypothetical protein